MKKNRNKPIFINFKKIFPLVHQELNFFNKNLELNKK